MSIIRGTILGGLSTVPDLDLALTAYRDVLGLKLLEEGPLPASLAASWGCPANAGSRHAVLQPESGEACFFRLVEQPAHPDFTPTTSFGWAAFECSVEDVWRWPNELPASMFTVVGMPKTLANMKPTFIPMQTLGPGKELIYLNEVLEPEGDLDLPMAKSAVDRIFICVLAAKDRAASVRWYEEALGLDKGIEFTIPYSMINKAFDLPASTLTTLTMITAGRMPIVEIDDYPRQTVERPRHEGMLVPGNALVTLAVESLDACKVEWITPPEARDGALYEGRRAGTAMGAAGELVELVEVG